MNLQKIFLLFILSIIILFSNISFSQNLTFEFDLKLIEGGCAGYENSLVQLYYSNGNLVNNSDFLVQIYDGPLQSMGLLLEFEVSNESQLVPFEKALGHRYDIIVPNDNHTYLGTTGKIDIVDCGFTTFEPLFSYQSILQITTTSDAGSEIVSNVEIEEFEFENDLEIKFFQINTQSFRQRDQISFLSNNNMWISTDSENWEEILNNHTIANINTQSPLILALETNQRIQTQIINNNNENNYNNNESIIGDNETSIQTPLRPGRENTQPVQSSQTSVFSIQSSNNSLLFTLAIVILILGGIFILIFLKGSKKSSSDYDYSNNNHVELNTHQIPSLMESRIITYIEMYKEHYSTEEIIKQLISNGFDRETIVQVIQTYVEKQKAQK
ncbi:MAG: hypothetical protein LAT82_03240 [Nanoarchaeota archaeon]|nr:hypothetical protein [Nanoarchaeota archaeon]